MWVAKCTCVCVHTYNWATVVYYTYVCLSRETSLVVSCLLYRGERKREGEGERERREKGRGRERRERERRETEREREGEIERRENVLPPHSQVTFTASIQTSSGCSSTDCSRQRQTTSSWVTTWTEASSPWRPSAFSWPTRSSTPRISSSSAETTSVPASTESTASTTNVSCNFTIHPYLASFEVYQLRLPLIMGSVVL